MAKVMIGDDDTDRRKIGRRGALKWLLGGAAATAAGCAVDGFFIEPRRLSITRRVIHSGGLPHDLNGLKVGLLSDFHFSPGNDELLLEKVVGAVRREKVDVLALTGDYMCNNPKVVAPMLEILKHLDAAQGVFAVMGNHDGWAGNRATIRREFESAGIGFLINQHSLVRIRGTVLAVAGTDFVWLGKPDVEKTLHGIPAKTPILAMVHEPDYFDTVVAQRPVMLQVSGHTHGGQCRVPGIGYAPRRVKMGKKYLYGEYHSHQSKLFVTRGVGTTGLRARFACLPEFAVLTLRT
jgi:predicted MPP superfamily phosphohydrolase